MGSDSGARLFILAPESDPEYLEDIGLKVGKWRARIDHRLVFL